MSAMERGLRRAVTIIVAVLVPFIILMGTIRLVMTAPAVRLEYSMPYFPADTYGFTQADRLHWGLLSLDYLYNREGISFLADLKFDNGQPIYNERELSHMADVKRVLQGALLTWRLALAVLVGISLAVWWRGWGQALRRGLSWGGWITVSLLLAMLLGVATSFNALFTQFHHLFFTGDSWIFLYSDTLIRLFPIRLWEDGFTAIGVLSLAMGAALGWFLRDR